MPKPTKTTILPLRNRGLAYTELRPLVETTLRSGISVLVRGHPGVGKSTMANEVASSMGLPIEDIRLAQRDPAELSGVYFPDRDKNELALFAPEWVQRACNQPMFIFLDEINAGVTKLHQAAAYQIVLEHRVGPYVFHPETVVMAAGNMEEDGHIVSTLSSALCNRFAHYTLRPCAETWLEWGTSAGIHPAILGYIGRHKESALYQQNDEYAFPSPRSWAMASQVFSNAEAHLGKRVVAACVGNKAAGELFSFISIYQKIDPARVILKGKMIDFTLRKHAEPSFIYAAIFAVANWLVHEEEIPDEALPNVVQFVQANGLDPEFGFLFLRHINKRADLIARLRPFPEYRALAKELVLLHAGLVA